MADGEARNISEEGNESKVCTTKCTLITVSVVAGIALLVGVIVAVVLLVPTDNGKLMSSFTLNRRSLNRFRRDHADNKICWDRRPDKDSFFSVIDTHNHFRPFNGPAVPFETYFQWMQDAGIIFSTMFGIGQLIKKTNQDDPDCCYYLHCPTFNYSVVPDPTNDKRNAEEYTKYKKDFYGDLKSKIHLTLSATYPNLQAPGDIMTILGELENEFPKAFKWAGEINVIKHALVGNGFFKEDTSPRITKQFLDDGNLDPFFRKMEETQWPVTIHCDCGCDNYNAIPKGALDNNPIKDCDVPEAEKDLAFRESAFWRELLGEFYPAFFYTNFHGVGRSDGNLGRPNFHSFRKVQHLQLMDTILTRYPNMKVVWAHMCLNKELLSLHPRVHTHIMEKFLFKFPNLYVDISWDVLAKLLLLNYNEMEPKDLSQNHTDIHAQLEIWNRTHIEDVMKGRKELHEKWEQIKDIVHATGSYKKLLGPTYAFVVYLDLFKKYPDRFVTGTDFVSSMGEPEDYPGMKTFKWPPGGCMKDEANHKRQVTDTSAVNIFFDNEVFRKVVLGENYFKLTGLDDVFAAPKVCDESVMT